MTTILQQRFTNIWISIDTIFKMTKLGKDHDHALKVINNFVDRVIAKRKVEWNLKKLENGSNPTKKRLALLDLLFQISEDGAYLSDIDMREEVHTFMFAGHDTVGTSVSWILYALGRHPEYQKRIIEEYNGIVGTKEITLEHLSKLVWLEACIKEAWRLYPVVPLLARQINNPLTICKC